MAPGLFQFAFSASQSSGEVFFFFDGHSPAFQCSEILQAVLAEYQTLTKDGCERVQGTATFMPYLVKGKPTDIFMRIWMGQDS